MIGDMLEGRTKDGARLVFGWYLKEGAVWFLAVKPDGTVDQIPLPLLSVDWHHDSKDGWKRDFDEEGE